MAAADDDTLRILPSAVPKATRSAMTRAAVVVAVLAASAGTGWYWSGPATPPPVPLAVAVLPPSPSPIAARQPIPLLTEAELLELRPARPEMWRLRENPRVFVLVFPDLEQQGAAFNRAAALIEKAGLPRDRLLSQTELAEAIARNGDTPATWYYGHDYRTADLRRFFALAERDRVALNDAELWVREQLALAEAAGGTGALALVSTAAQGLMLDAGMRAAVLRHEIGHGHYFTIPGFAEHVHAVWRHRFSEAERAAFRAFLAREGYDPTNEDLLANETMAYLLFTPDPRFFAPAMVGLAEPAIRRMRDLLRDGLPLP
jgi:hypothetical protein